MIFVLTGSIALIIVFLTYILSYYYEALSCREIYRNNSSSINQASSTVQFLSESVNSVLLQISKNSSVNKLFMSDSYNNNEIYQAQKELSAIRHNNSKIYSIYVYDEYSDSIFESMDNSQTFQTARESFYDADFVECLDRLYEMKAFTPVVRTVPVIRSHAPESSLKVFTYFYFEPYFSTNEKKSHVIAINISTTWMSEALGYFHGANSDVNNIEIVGRDGKVIFSKDNSLIGAQYEDMQVLEKIMEMKDPNGYFVDESGTKKLVTYTKSAFTGYEDWIFLSASDYEEVIRPIQETKRFMYRISAVVLLLSIASFLLILKHFSNPIKTAMNKAKLLEKERLEKQKREAQSYLKRILEGDIEEDTRVIQSRFEQLQIDYDFQSQNQLLLISIDDIKSLRRRFRENFSQTLQEIYEIIENTVSGQFGRVLPVSWQEGSEVLIIFREDGDQTEPEEQSGPDGRMEEIFGAISGELNEKLCCSMSLSISSIGQSVKDLPFLLSEVLEIHTYRYLYGYGRLLTADVIKNEEQQPWAYPKEDEKNILTNLLGGKLEETQEAYEKYVEQLSGMPVGEIKISFLLLAYSIKYASKNTTIEASNSLLNFEQFFAKIQSLETIEEVNNMFCHLFQEIIQIIDTQRSTKYDELIDFMKDEIKKNYGQVDMSIKEIADKVDMSAAYLGRIFKQHTGVAFTEYLTKYRLQAACNELLNSEKTVNEISDSVGFTNSSYFYLVFKKYLDCTPTQYRNNNLEEK